MNSATKSRTQRRMEKKQALILLVLVLAVSLASFTLGVIVGQTGAERDLALKQQAAEKVLVAKVPPRTEPLVPVKPANTPNVAPAAEMPSGETKLTFYDSLAKESNAPLGSGINLPPQEKKSLPVSPPPIVLPEKPIVKKAVSGVAASSKPLTVAAPAVQAASGQPKVDPQGSYSLQVGSFAAAVDAGKMKQSLVDKGYPAFMVEADLGSKGIWYRVRMGPYADGMAAKTMQALVEKQDKIKGFISRQ